MVENQTQVSDAVKHICNAAALNKMHADQSITDLLGEIARMSEKPVPSPGGVVAVRSSQQLAQALGSAATKFICLTPGDYPCLPWPPAFRVDHDVTMVGLGNVTFLKSASHVFDIRARSHMSNISTNRWADQCARARFRCMCGERHCLVAHVGQLHR